MATQNIIYAKSISNVYETPYQNYDGADNYYFRPEGENKAIISLSAAAVQAEFLIGEGTITLIKFAAGNKPPVRGILDKPMIQKELVGLMRAQGVDIFPDYDSHCYIEGKAVYMVNT